MTDGTEKTQTLRQLSLFAAAADPFDPGDGVLRVPLLPSVYPDQLGSFLFGGFFSVPAAQDGENLLHGLHFLRAGTVQQIEELMKPAFPRLPR